jgi:hypothetical protein
MPLALLLYAHPPPSPSLLLYPQIDGFSPSTGTFNGHADLSWEALKANGPPVNIGIILTSATRNKTSFLPTEFTVEGSECLVVVMDL